MCTCQLFLVRRHEGVVRCMSQCYLIGPSDTSICLVTGLMEQMFKLTVTLGAGKVPLALYDI